MQGTVQDDYATKLGLDPIRVPDYNRALNQLKPGSGTVAFPPLKAGTAS